MSRGLDVAVLERERRWAVVYTHRERLLRLARARVDDVHDAEDCVSEAMLRCVEFADLDETRLGQFLTTVTLRLCTDVHRRNTRGDKLSRKLAAYSSVEPGPEEAVCDRAESAWLSNQLATLPERQRQIIAARAEGLSCAAVAERLLVSYTTIESALARVRRSMRLTLESTLGITAAPYRRWVPAFGDAVTAAVAVLGTISGTAATAPAAVPAPAAVLAASQVSAPGAAPSSPRREPIATAARRAAAPPVMVRVPAPPRLVGTPPAHVPDPVNDTAIGTPVGTVRIIRKSGRSPGCTYDPAKSEVDCYVS